MSVRDPWQLFLSNHAGCTFLPTFLSSFPQAQVYLVGGAVRDVFLSRLCTDADFVIAGVARSTLESWFQERGTLDFVGQRFGVYKFRAQTAVSADDTIDIALPRTEHVSAESRGGYREFDVQADEHLPIEDDLARRDFTINAMAYDVRTQTIIDPHGGEQDLSRKQIRAVGNSTARFEEDLSRILRALRFSVQLDFDIEPTTWEAVVKMLPEIHRQYPDKTGQAAFVVPRETIGRELAKMCVADSRGSVAILEKASAFPLLFPDLKEALSADYLAPLQKTSSLTTMLAVLLRAVPSERVGAALRGVGLSTLPLDSNLRVHEDHVAWIVGQLERGLLDPGAVRASIFEKTFLNPRGQQYLDVLLALGFSNVVRQVRERSEAIAKRCGTGSGQKVPPLLSGHDLITLGIAPGPEVGAWLDDVRDRQLEGELRTAKEAIAYVKRTNAQT